MKREVIPKLNDMNNKEKPIILAREVEYYPDTDDILLIRCPKCSRENYALAVADGICCWCGFDGRSLIK